MNLLISAMLFMAEPSEPFGDPIADDAQYVVDRVLDAYRNHPAGEGVFDYLACHHFDQELGHALIRREQRTVRLAPHQVWDIETLHWRDYRTNPSRAFLEAYEVIWRATLLTRFDVIGLERCSEILDAYTMPFQEYLEWSNDNRTLNIQDAPDLGP